MFLRTNQKDRWLLSYADFVTLLFATFVLMYATSKAKEHIPRVSDTPTSARSITVASTASTPAVPPQNNLLDYLRNSLEVERQSGIVTISSDQRGIEVSLDDKLCFLPGQADVQPYAEAMFGKVAGVLAAYGNRVLLEGHTDSVPIHNNHFHSNWELSTARSIAVMELMERTAHLHPERFMIGGSAANTPVSSNETEQGRARNRRVEIVVLDGPSAAPANP